MPRCVGVSLARIPEGKDPADYIGRAGAEAFSDVLNGAVDALEFKWFKTQARFSGTGSDADRRSAVMDFLGLIAEASGTAAVDAIQRGLLLNQVAHLLGIERREVDRLLVQLDRKSARRSHGSPQGHRAGRGTVPADEEQAAWVTLLEVMLAEPAVAARSADMPDPSRIASAPDRRIATIAADLAAEGGEYRLADVLARCSHGDDALRVEELARRGAARGNYDNTFRIAVERIRRAASNAEVERSKKKIVSAKPGMELSEEANNDLKHLARGLREHRHFVPRGRRRGTGTAENEDGHSNNLAITEQP
jgi:DNA primase